MCMLRYAIGMPEAVTWGAHQAATRARVVAMHHPTTATSKHRRPGNGTCLHLGTLGAAHTAPLRKSKLRSNQSGTTERCRNGHPAGHVEREVLPWCALLEPPQ